MGRPHGKFIRGLMGTNHMKNPNDAEKQEQQYGPRSDELRAIRQEINRAMTLFDAPLERMIDDLDRRRGTDPDAEHDYWIASGLQLRVRGY